MTTHNTVDKKRLKEILYEQWRDGRAQEDRYIVTQDALVEILTLFDAALDKAVEEARIEEIVALCYPDKLPESGYNPLDIAFKRLANLKKGK